MCSSDLNEDGRLMSRHGQVEYLTTMKYIKDILSDIPDPKILEIGAGTGRYSVTLAKQGFNVTAIELLEHNLEVLKGKLDGSEHITAIQGNAMDLSAFDDNAFDLTMVLGPCITFIQRMISCVRFQRRYESQNREVTFRWHIV